LVHPVPARLFRSARESEADELTRVPWERLAALLPGKAFDPGQTAVNKRLMFVNGVFWALAPAPMGAICLNGTGSEKQRQTLLAR
jgi:hypothetical protein